MSKSSDKKRQIRLDPDIVKWMDGYRKLIGFNTPYSILAHMMMEKGKEYMPLMNGGKK